MRNTDDFRYTKKAITLNHQINFTVSKGEWNTKEDTGKSIKNALHVLWYAKKVKSNNEKIKLLAFTVIKLC